MRTDIMKPRARKRTRTLALLLAGLFASSAGARADEARASRPTEVVVDRLARRRSVTLGLGAGFLRESSGDWGAIDSPVRPPRGARGLLGSVGLAQGWTLRRHVFLELGLELRHLVTFRDAYVSGEYDNHEFIAPYRSVGGRLGLGGRWPLRAAVIGLVFDFGFSSLQQLRGVGYEGRVANPGIGLELGPTLFLERPIRGPVSLLVGVLARGGVGSMRFGGTDLTSRWGVLPLFLEARVGLAWNRPEAVRELP